jgi:hypothetical protein
MAGKYYGYFRSTLEAVVKMVSRDGISDNTNKSNK